MLIAWRIWASTKCPIRTLAMYLLGGGAEIPQLATAIAAAIPVKVDSIGALLPGEVQGSIGMTSTDNSYLENGATGNAGGVSPGNSVITKSSLGYDGETHEITWQVVVNASEQSLPDAYLKDVIPAGQAYEPGTFSISPADAPANSLTSAQSFKVSGDSTSGTTLEYKFGAISSTYTITFKTQLTDPTSWAGNSNTTFVNDAWLYPTGSGDSSHGI